MKRIAPKYLLVSSLLAGLLIIMAHTSVFAQSDSPSLTIKQQLLNGGFYQVIDAATAPCSGQCFIPNWQTSDCTCPQNFAPAEMARTLTDVGTGSEGSTCGARIFTCVWQEQ